MKTILVLAAVLGIVLNFSPLKAQVTVPINDNFADSTPLFGTAVTVTGNNILATIEPGEVGIGFQLLASSKTVWYSYTAPIDGVISFTQIGTGFTSVISVFQGNPFGPSTLSNITFLDYDFDSPSGGDSVLVDGIKGQTYYVAVYGYAGISTVGAFRLNITYPNLPPPVNDSFSTRTIISGSGGTFVRSNIGATREPGEPLNGGNQGGASLWYFWTAPRTGLVRIQSSSKTIPTTLGVYVGSAVSQLVNAAEPTNAGIVSTGQDFLDFKVFAGESYSISVDGLAGRVGDVTLTLAQGPVLVLRGVFNFGTIPTNTIRSTILKITNTGNSSLKVRGIDLPKGFTGNLRTTIPPNGTRSVRISFAPGRPGNYSGNLSVRSDSVTKANTIKIRATAN